MSIGTLISGFVNPLERFVVHPMKLVKGLKMSEIFNDWPCGCCIEAWYDTEQRNCQVMCLKLAAWNLEHTFMQCDKCIHENDGECQGECFDDGNYSKLVQSGGLEASAGCMADNG